MCVWFLYMGVPDSHLTGYLYYQFIILSAIPVLFNKGFVTVASGISLFIYVLLYIPIIYATSIVPISSGSNILFAFVAMFLMCSFFATDKLCLFKKLSRRSRKRIGIHGFEYITIFVMALVLLMNLNNLRFVNILTQRDVMYDLRAARGGNALSGYLVSWCQYALLPLLLVYYLRTRNWIRYFLTFFGFFIIFLICMLKSTFIMPVLMTVVYFVFEKLKPNRSFLRYVAMALGGLSITLYLFIDNTIVYELAAIFVMRMQCIETWLASIYLNFFETNPYTYYTHINIINFITGGYPYNDVLGRTVTEGGMNANASFFLTDGYAAAGIFGVILSGIFFIIFKSILNSVSKGYNKYYIVAFMISAITGLLNVSLFTAVFSCGFLIFFLCLKYINLKEFEE